MHHPLSGKGIRDQMFGGYGVATVIVEILLEVGEFNVDRGTELTVVNVIWEEKV